MLEKPNNYLRKRSQELGLERGEALVKIQSLLDKSYPNQARAVSLNDQVLRIVTVSSSVASDLRLRQIDRLKQFRTATNQPINNMRIQVGSI